MQSSILIAGPTASGKTALAVELAQKLDGAIINADSMQVYNGLLLLSASPTKEERRLVPHYLFNHVDPHIQYSVGDWLRDAQSALAHIVEQGKRPIFVGGTGLYFRALTHGLVEIPPIEEAFRQQLLDELGLKGCSALHNELKAVDPELAARVHINDQQRVLRGIEVYRATGKALSLWQKEVTRPPIVQTENAFCLMPSRDWLYQRCDARFEGMMAAGALEEVAAFRANHKNVSGAAGKTLGLTELSAVLDGSMTQDAALAQAKMQTRRYAKRQMTWFRNQMITSKHLSEQDYYNNIGIFFSLVS